MLPLATVTTTDATTVCVVVLWECFLHTDGIIQHGQTRSIHFWPGQDMLINVISKPRLSCQSAHFVDFCTTVFQLGLTFFKIKSYKPGNYRMTSNISLVGQSVGLSVGPSISPSVSPSVRQSVSQTINDVSVNHRHTKHITMKLWSNKTLKYVY